WLSDRAWAAAGKAKSPRYYFDLRIERKSQKENTTAWTPAISLVSGLKVALDMMQEEGLENMFERHARLARGARAAMGALGLEIFPKDLMSEAVTVVCVPEGIDGKAIPRMMQENQGVTIAGGQSGLSGEIFRIGHLGYVDESDILVAVGGVEATLACLGYSLGKGAGLAAAQEVFGK
ncbi:MAG: alanine--glyoxylate aminotransferase family protein, partial [bacterium]